MNNFKKNLKVEIGNMEDIQLEDNKDDEKYQEYLRQRRKRELEKPIWRGVER